MPRLALVTSLAALLAAGALASRASAEAVIDILYLEREIAPPPTLSNLDPPPEDEGLMGARLAVAENATTGRFLGQTYALAEVIVPEDADWSAAARAALADGPELVVVNAPADDLLALADAPEAAGRLIFNAAAPDDRLRGEACRANVLHTLPSRAMLADALMQFLSLRRWSDLMLIEGEGSGDAAFAEALRRSAAKFGLTLEAEKVWAFDADMRRNAAQEGPPFTQGPDVDVYLVADESEDWARYLLYNTWEPRPVAGSEGLTPVAWSPVVEAWGAAQLQDRFRTLAGRDMTSVDYAAWAAVRAIGEGATRAGAADAEALRAFLFSDAFALGGFKGRPLSFRAWDGQLRQPIPLVHPRGLVETAPIEGFLHERTELDTLGVDEAESACQAFEPS